MFFALRYPKKYQDEIKKYADMNGLQTSLVSAMIYCESRFNREAESNVGAKGLMQLMPETAKFIAEKEDIEFEGNLFDAEKNIELGCAYIKYLFNKFPDEKTMLYAYNAGEGNVKSWLNEKEYSLDGRTLFTSPVKVSNQYVESVIKIKKYY